MSDKNSTSKNPLTNKEIALELTRLQVQLECAYTTKGYTPTPSVGDTYHSFLAELNNGQIIG